MKKLSYLVYFLLLSPFLFGQDYRYREEVFTDIKVTKNVIYGYNATAMGLLDTTKREAVLEPLLMDVYEPDGDTEELRPLIIYFHSGNFLPTWISGNVVGTKEDSSSVEFCRQLARSGYVVASADYRLLWNPKAATDYERRFGIINAAYRGVQDANTCIRYFRELAQEGGNPWRICEEKIALFGDDTGGYLSVHAAILSEYSEILENPQLWVVDPVIGPIPMIIESVNGDVKGKIYGINTPGIPPFPIGDTLCVPNWITRNSSFMAAVNLGGATAFKKWIDPGEPPIISIHTPYDITTPCGDGPVFVPPDLYVMNVSGSCSIAEYQDSIGNTDLFDNIDDYLINDFQRSVEDMALSRNGGLNSLLLIKGDTISDINPWVHWDPATNPGHENAIKNNPRMSPEKAASYRDTILAYVLPRLYIALDIENTTSDGCITAIKTIPTNSIDISIYPNPSSSSMVISTPSDFIMRRIIMYESSGREVLMQNNINDSTYNLDVAGKLPGIYLLQIWSDTGVISRKIIVH